MQLWQLVDMLDNMAADQLTASHLTRRLDGVSFDPVEFAPYLSWVPGGYTRNGVHRTQGYEIILMAWDAGALSPVHAHADQTCWLSVQQGHLTIESYACAKAADRGRIGDGVALILHDTAHLGPGEVEREMDGLDVHRVSNAGRHTARAISLHIYARPFDSCITYDVKRSKARMRKLAYSTVGPAVQRPKT